ncbi:MAG: hypothetical protein A2114_01420 [Candidatus Vogelbacteria bacterium GWA1_51_14]|uniref:Dipeptidylpeptidase IV N-terminal domain-containing protein n=1 Tax=Candidatus Vogelbacteria bacterium GWA1_51_14 TaxID=1802435 RepID=A0A1G2QBK9_9BACT|nr:MAG: hypothetical protein A2114_01420 [Candidatus Vogelbacteria bacterium GWA1_51_14]
MPQKNILIIGGVVVILIIAGWWWFSQNQVTSTPTSPTTQSQTPSFFPVGAIKDAIQNIITTTTNNIQEIIPGGQSGVEVDDQLVKQVVSQPIADYGFITYQGTSTLFYVEQNTGHIFVVASNTPMRLSNKSIPRIKGVKTAENASRYYFYISSLDEQNDLIWQKGELLKATSSELVLTAMAGNIKALEVSPKGDQVFVLKEVDGASLGQILTLNLEVPTTVFTSPFTEWVVEWMSDTKISFQTKPSSGVNGSIYLLDIKNKSFTPVIIGISGLIGKISPDTNHLIYSSSQGGNLVVESKNLNKAGEFNYSVKTLADKCVWLPDSVLIACGTPKDLVSLNYPDAWYQGSIGFNDNIWLIDIIMNQSFLIFDLDESIDLINLNIASNNPLLLYFQNKRDGSLWSFDLNTGFDL